MSPPDEIKAESNSKSGKDQSQKSFIMDTPSELSSASTSNPTMPGTISSIPLITASPPTLKCSINDQMKTFDPGEETGIERLTSNHCGNSVLSGKSSYSGLIKNNNKNYKAGSKINKLADMLAKRSQNVVEVTQNNTSNLITDIAFTSKIEETVTLNNISDTINFDKKLMKNPIFGLEKTVNSKKLDLFKKSRRKSVPNQSCNLNQFCIQSNSKSCLDFSKLFSMKEDGKPEFNALGESLNKLQTDESTKRKTFRKKLKNVELTLILPEKKRRFSAQNENIISNKMNEKILDVSAEVEVLNENNIKNVQNPKEIVASSMSSPPVNTVSSTNLRKETKAKQRKSKRLVETSTQTADIEFISVVKTNGQSEISMTEENKKLNLNYKCERCSQILALDQECRDGEKDRSSKNSKPLTKCQYCSKKIPSLDELKSHLMKKHPNKYVNCVKCNEKFFEKEKLSGRSNQEVQSDKKSESGTSLGSVPIQEISMPEKKKEGEESKVGRQESNATDLRIDVTFEGSRKSSTSPRNGQKCSPKEIKTEEQLLEMEMLFYSHLSGNIRENLTNHLDGKMDQNGCPIRTDKVCHPTDSAPAKTKGGNLLSAMASGGGCGGGLEIQSSRGPSPYKTRSKTPNPLPPTAKKFKKLPNWQQKFWEKYNFPTNYRYEHRFWDKNYLNVEKSALHLKDLSCLDIKTQLIMRENIKKLENEKSRAEDPKPPAEELKFPDYLSLIPRSSNEIGREIKSVQEGTVSGFKGKKSVRREREEFKRSSKSFGTELPADANRKQSERARFEGIRAMTTRRNNSIDLTKEDAEESLRRRKGSLDSSSGKKMTLRRQTSLDSLQKNNECDSEKKDQLLNVNLGKIDMENTPPSPSELAEISGEWVKPRSYLCGTCCTKFTNLWELEDHKWVSHPNVWCTHYEFEDEKIEKLFQLNETESRETNSSDSSKVKLADLYKRYLLPHGFLKTAKLVPDTNFPEECTKCKKNCANSSEMHKHMLDCGGDTTWFLTMYSSPMTIKRKWRPFGSRRRKQLGRRDVKRNIPNTPNLRSSYQHYQHRIRTKPGDVESIQKMLANLPEKRARRAINFDEIKTRSQATIHSNRLLRKRFKSSFANNFLKLKNFKQRRQIKQDKKEGNSKSGTDISSESTPVGSPKRRNKLKESNQVRKGENVADNFNETSNDRTTKSSKKKKQIKKNESISSSSSSSSLRKQKNDAKKINRRKIGEEKTIKTEKPVTRRNNSASGSASVEKFKRKSAVTNEKITEELMESCVEIVVDDKEEKEIFKIGKKFKKNDWEEDEESLGKKSSESVEVVETHSESRLEIQKSGKNESRKVKEKKGELDSGEKKSDRLNIQSRTILRLKQNTREKTELVKRMKKKFQNSKRILEMKETKICEGGSRRSLRLKYLQGSDEVTETIPDDLQSIRPGEECEEIFSRDLKIKKPALNLENCMTRPKRGESLKSLKVINEKKTEESKEISNWDKIRRSSRALPSRKESFSQEEKMEIDLDETFQGAADHSKNASLFLRKNSRNDQEVLERIEEHHEESPNKKSPTRSQNDKSSNLSGGEKFEFGLIFQQQQEDQQQPSSSPLTRTRSRFSGCKEKSQFSDAKTLNFEKSDSRKNCDLEEMPILARVEPIRGKFDGKNEKEIPILMPFVEEESSRSREDLFAGPSEKEQNFNLISFKVVKKRNRTFKEVAPLKIVKKIGNSEEEFTGGKNDSYKLSSAVGKTKKKKISVLGSEREMNPPEIKPTKSTTSMNKYFLGICPCEIDKGREQEGGEKEEANDESGSDSEPLITLINQSQKTSLSRSSVTIPTGNGNEIIRIEGKEEEMSESLSKDFGTPLEDKEKTLSKSVSESPFDLCTARKTIGKPFDELLVSSGDSKINESERKLKKKKSKSKIEKKKKISDKKEGEERRTKSEEPEPHSVSEEPPGANVISDEILRSGLEEREIVFPERRSRRISKEIKSTNEFVIDDPLILVDELWSDLDSDSEGFRKRTKKSRKKSVKKKFAADEKKTCEVNLEELLRNFGENKELAGSQGGQKSRATEKVPEKSFQNVGARKVLENRVLQKSFRRLSLKLFRFNKGKKNLGNLGERLFEAKKIPREKRDRIESERDRLPDLPFLVTEIKENPVQVIQCRSQKSGKPAKKGSKTPEATNLGESDLHFKISLPLETINRWAVFNNNHLTELDAEKQIGQIPHPLPEAEAREPIETGSPEKGSGDLQEEVDLQAGEIKSKAKRSEVIDKIFYCEICKTYYYSSSQLKIHKLSNRHKLKESEFLSSRQPHRIGEEANPKECKPEAEVEPNEGDSISTNSGTVEKAAVGESATVQTAAEPGGPNDDEMPILEGPFIENRPADADTGGQPQSGAPDTFRFSQESLKDIQRAIGCTDEEMLILTLIGENTIEIEGDTPDSDPSKSGRAKSGTIPPEKAKSEEEEKGNGIFKVDLKQRMTSALACLVNKAVFNLLQKYESVAKSSVNPEAVSLLSKLSNLSKRKKILQLNELLKRQREAGESSVGNAAPKDTASERKANTISYKYQCTICGSRFEKASTRECHISRSHRGKAKKPAEEMQVPAEPEWNDFWNYDGGDPPPPPGEDSQFLCSDCGINFVSPREVLEHQKLEHKTGIGEAERIKNSGPLQSSTIGSSDEIIIEGKKGKRRPKVFSTEELDQQRIIANNELRKLDRKFAGKSKGNKVKWGMDALRFTVEKENKVVAVAEEEEGEGEEKGVAGKDSDVKNVDSVPKLNFSRKGNVPEFKVIQKHSLENRFQKIIDNKLKRKSSRQSQLENETDDAETEVMLVPVVVKKKNKKEKAGKPKKNVDVYDFNESDSEEEPIVLSHIKKPMTLPTKVKLVKAKEGPSKNKADSTTKDLVPDDYDSEDSLPLSIVKKSKPGEEEEEEEDEEKEEKNSVDGAEKSEGILEQVEYLIEQLENETGPSEGKSDVKEVGKEIGDRTDERNVEAIHENEEKNNVKEEDESPKESLRVSLTSKLLQLQYLSGRSDKSHKGSEKESKEQTNEMKEESEEKIWAEAESSQSTFDEEDSMPLVFMSKRVEGSNPEQDEKKGGEEVTMDVSTTASEDVRLFEPKENKGDVAAEPHCSSPVGSLSMGEDGSMKSSKPFENLNGNVIYCRNESTSDFDSDFSDRDDLLDSNYGKAEDENYLEADGMTEKAPVVVVCSKGDEEKSDARKRPPKPTIQRKKKRENVKSGERKKKRFPLLTATIETLDEAFVKGSENFNSVKKKVIVKKIWSRRPKSREDERSTDWEEEEEEDSCLTSPGSPVGIARNNEESQTEIEKELIVNKIWSRKRIDHEVESFEKSDEKSQDLKINKTEVSDEVVIKCGPKAVFPPKSRRKGRGGPSESSKETIMRKIWSGKCTFQTKAALKTYESDVLPECKEDRAKPKKRGRRPPEYEAVMKRTKLKEEEEEEEENDDDEDDLDSLLEEIEREQLEKAIRSEFLQMRRSEKANVEMSKDGSNPTMGLFAETSLKRNKKDSSKERKKRGVKRNPRHPRRSLLKRKKFIKKPIRRIPLPEGRHSREKSDQANPEEESRIPDQSGSLAENGNAESKLKSRRHKKHRHKHHHHHHRHKHKKSKHRKKSTSPGKHKSKHKCGDGEKAAATVAAPDADSFTILEKICMEIPNRIEKESAAGFSSPLFFEETTKDCDEIGSEGESSPGKEILQNAGKAYEFAAEDGCDFLN